MPRIPNKNRDLRRLVIRTAVLRILGFTAWVTALYLGANSYNQNHQTYPPDRLMIGWKMVLWVAISIISGCYIFKLWRFFANRPFVGTIERYSHSRSYGTANDASNGNDFRINTSLRVRTENGKVRRIRFEQKNGFYQYYHEGNRIARLGGLPYPINLDPDCRTGCVCAACGAHSNQWQNFCPVCNRSMIDPNDLTNKITDKA